MKYFMIEGTINETISIGENEMHKAMGDYHAFLQKGLDEGFILLSAPRVKATGGFLIMKGQSLIDIENYLSGSPFKILGIQEFKISEFKLMNCQPMLKGWFE